MIEIRRAALDDLMTYFHWANDPVVRANSINTKPIPLENHKMWFTARLNDRNTRFYICLKNGAAIGQVRLDLKEEYALINYSVDQKFRGQGLGTHILKLSMEEFRKERTNKGFIGKVQLSNRASSRVFEKLGFQEKEKEVINGATYHVFYLT